LIDVDAEAEAIHINLNGIGNDIYSMMDAYLNPKEIWLAIEPLQQGESINIQDVKTKLFWEFSKFTSRDLELIESYYTRFYRMINEMVRNKLKVDTMQVNVQFLQQLQSEWSRFVAIVKNKGKEIVKASSPPPEFESEEDSDEERAQRDKSAKMVKDYANHKEYMLLCKKEVIGIQLSAEYSELIQETYEEPDDQKLEAYTQIRDIWVIDILKPILSNVINDVYADYGLGANKDEDGDLLVMLAWIQGLRPLAAGQGAQPHSCGLLEALGRQLRDLVGFVNFGKWRTGWTVAR
ncbi:hypothetical protein Tco_0038742, partial [Tanacetum coccineum]